MRLLSILYDVLHAIMDVLCDKINLFCFRVSYLHVIIVLWQKLSSNLSVDAFFSWSLLVACVTIAIMLAICTHVAGCYCLGTVQLFSLVATRGHAPNGWCTV